MQLNQPIPPSYSDGNDQYDFILSGNQKPKKSILPGGNSRKQRMILVVGGFLGLMVIFAIIFALLFSSGGGDKQAILEVAQTQNEIIRVSNGSVANVRDANLQGFTQNVALTTTTAQLETTALLTKQGVKVKPKELGLSKNSKTDTALESARQAGRYDEELLKILEKALADYKVQLSQTYTKATTNSQKVLLKKLFNQVNDLIKNQPTSS